MTTSLKNAVEALETENATLRAALIIAVDAYVKSILAVAPHTFGDSLIYSVGSRFKLSKEMATEFYYAAYNAHIEAEKQKELAASVAADIKAGLLTKGE